MICTKYRMAWVVVMFDLPVGTPQERKLATHFREDLIRDGYFKMQFSVYARPCGSPDKAETHMRRLKSRIPPCGEVRALTITDAQWGRMVVFRGQKQTKSEKMPEQLMFF
jgi:CRISPR-associated protein Cas2